MDRHLFGEACALLTAVTWGFALVLFKRSGEHIAPIPLNLFKNSVGLLLLVVTLAVTGDGIDNLKDQPLQDIGILLISGVIGIAIADTILFYALNLVGVGVLSVVDCTYSPIIILLSFLFLGEGLTPNHYAGGALIFGGVVVATRIVPPADRTRLQMVGGMALGVLAILLMGIGIVMAKPVLEGFPVIWATTLRLGIGTVVLALWALASSQRKALWSVFRPSRVWRDSLPASILGTYVALVLWIAGFKYTYATIASLLNQTSVVFALIFATIILKEPFTRRKAVAVGLAMGGVLVVRLSG